MIKLAIATPIDGLPESAMVSYGHALAVARLIADKQHVEMLDPALLGYPSDLVRARSRAVRLARDIEATHVLWLDGDVVPKAGAVAAMLATGHDVVGCPYPRKRVHWERMGQVMMGEEPEWRAYDYAYHHSDGPEGTARIEVVGGCIPVRRLAMGCMLTSMRALDAMTQFYREELWFTDVVEGKHYDGVALFQLLVTETLDLNGRRYRTLLSEDYSFCERYARMPDAKPAQMLVTHPADHQGHHLFKGAPEGLVYAR